VCVWLGEKIPSQTGDHSEAIRVRLAGREHRNRVKRIAVSIDVAAEEGRAAKEARNAGPRCVVAQRALRWRRDRALSARRIAGVDIAQAFLCGDRAAAIRLYVLVARIDRQDEPVGQREFGRNSDVAGVRRIVAAVELGSAAAHIICRRRRSVGDTGLRRVDLARKVDPVETLVGVARVALR